MIVASNVIGLVPRTSLFCNPMDTPSSMDMRVNINSCWTQSLQRGERPTHANLREHLLAVHRMYPGFTESFALQCQDALGRNSYELLANVVDPTRHSNILDLACGSGVLLEICRRRCGPEAVLTGIDISPEELALARKRNPDPTIQLHQGVAQDLHYLGDATVDVVLCHWALTLMGEVPQVLSEARRVLKPDGIFAAVVDGDPASAPGYAEVHDIIYDLVQHDHPDYGAIDLGDPRVRTAQALKEIALLSFEGARVDIEPVVLNLGGAPELLAREAAGFFYASFVLSPPVHRQMLKKLENLFVGQKKDHESRFSLPVNQIVIRKQEPWKIAE